MNKMLLLTDQTKELVKNVLNSRSSVSTDKEVYEYVCYLLKRNRKEAITIE